MQGSRYLPRVDPLNLAFTHHRAGRTDEALSVCRAFLVEHPDHPEGRHLLGLILSGTEPEAALRELQRSIELSPETAEFTLNLGHFLKSQNRLREAAAAYRQAADLAPSAELLNSLGLLYQQLNELNAAIDCFRQCIELTPVLPGPYSNLGIALATAGRSDLAIECFHEALRIDPQLAAAHSNLAIALKDLGRLEECIDHAAMAIRLSPSDTAALCTMGDAFKDQARLDDAVACFRKAMRLDPSNVLAHDSLLYTLLYHPNFSPRDIFDEHLAWARQFTEPLATNIAAHANDRDPNRRLRIGYVSPDFCRHSLGLLIEPVLANHDHTQFTVICYSDVKRADDLTERIKSHVDFYESTAELSDAELAERIRRDGIDILVDLTSHMQGSRLLTFARKPAPVQVSYLAYPETTGLAAIDYLISDVHLHPADSEAAATETIYRLPETYWAYPAQADAPEVSPLPAVENGFVTFGSMNNFCKLNERVIELWRELLAEVTESRLQILINSRTGHYERAWLASLNMPMDRITLVRKRPRRRYLELYQGIDLSLDSFPCAGHTTSLDSLFMGVPVVTLPGAGPFSRAGVSQLTNIGLPEFIATSRGEYIRIAKAWANDLPRLAKLRVELRSKMLSSPIGDAARLAKNLEHGYRTVWKNFCG